MYLCCACLTQMSHTHIPVRNISSKPIRNIICYWRELNDWVMSPFLVAQQKGNEHPTPHLLSADRSGDERSPWLRMGRERSGGKEEEKTPSSCFCIQGTSPLPYYHIREPGPISAFITQPFPPPRISDSAILICLGDTRQPAPLSERKPGLLENISEQLIPQLYFRPWEVNA